MNTNNKDLKWIIYARKSTESSDRQIQSIEDQIKIQEEIAKRNGYKIIEIISESKSAKAPYVREGFTRLQNLINEGRVDGILTWKTDRLFRNEVDAGFIQYALREGRIKCIKTPEREYYPSDNALLLSVESGMSSQFIKDLSYNVKRGMKSKAEKGWYPNMTPLGYLNSKTRERGAETVLTDEINFPIVRKMWDLLLTGNYSVPKILKIATDEWGLRTPKRRRIGGKATTVGNLHRIFNNIFYTGNFMFDGNIYEGKHEPMITMDEFDKAQVILGKKGKPRPKSLEFPYTGIMHCSECGAQITATRKEKHIKSTGKIAIYIYYHCTGRKKDIKCSQKSQFVKSEYIDDEIINILDRYTISEKFYNLAIDIIKNNHDNDSKTEESIYKSLQEKESDLINKINKTTNLLIEGNISTEEHKTYKDKFTLDLNKVRNELKNVDSKINIQNEITETAFAFLNEAIKEFEKKDLYIQKEVLSSLGLNHRISNKKLLIDLYSWLEIIKNGENEILPDLNRLELDKSLDNKAKTELESSIYARMCAELDLNQRSPKGDRFTVCCN